MSNTSAASITRAPFLCSASEKLRRSPFSLIGVWCETHLTPRCASTARISINDAVKVIRGQHTVRAVQRGFLQVDTNDDPSWSSSCGPLQPVWYRYQRRLSSCTVATRRKETFCYWIWRTHHTNSAPAGPRVETCQKQRFAAHHSDEWFNEKEAACRFYYVHIYVFAHT